MKSKVVFLVVPNVHVLDLAGPLQVMFEANAFGAAYELVYCAMTPTVRTVQGLTLAGLVAPPTVGEGDLVLVPGMDSRGIDALDPAPCPWLRAAYDAGAELGSICTGAFLLAEAGLLDGRSCTTHWKMTDALQTSFPNTRVLRGRLFVRDDRITTSAGVTSGIDMALALIENAHGPLVAARVAQELVVYFRRNGDSSQDSVFLRYRTHLNPAVHRVQDWLVAHPEESPNLDVLANVARLSPRHLTRVFREATGITLKTFATQLRLEVAAQLLHDPTETVENVASQCGYQDARQLRRVFKKHYGSSPAQWQRQRADGRTSS